MIPSNFDVTCIWCEERVEDLADLRELPMLGGPTSSAYYHNDCLIRSLVGSVAHQEGRCSCHGGVDEDDPALTRRQAATAAAEYFRQYSAAAEYFRQHEKE